MRQSLGDWPHEIIVVDDQSTDGCCHDLDQDVVVLRTRTRHGVSASRRLAVRLAKGDVYLFSDPHCHYDNDALRAYVQAACDKQAIICAKTTTRPAYNKPRWGGFLDKSDRGLKISYAKNEPAEYPACLGTIYAVQKDLYHHFGGWPELPGVWGYSEQAISLASWFAGVPIYIHPDYVCNHQHYHPKGGTRFNYRVPLTDQAQNGHWIHAAFFPTTYDHLWRPTLQARFRNKEANMACLHDKGWESKDPGVGRRTISQFRQEIANRSIRSEEDFFEMVLKTYMPNPTPELDQEFIAKQRKRSKPEKDYSYSHKRQDRALRWFVSKAPGCIKGFSCVDLGTRSGYVMQCLKEMGVSKVEGVEIVPETVQWARDNLGLNVINADMRHTPYKNDSWHRVLCIHSLEHVPDPGKVVEEMMRILTPGGWLLIVVPQEQEILGRYAHYSCFKNQQELEDLVNKYNPERIICETLPIPDKPKAIEILLAARKPTNEPTSSLISERMASPVSSTQEFINQQRTRCKVDDNHRKWWWRQKRAVQWFLEVEPKAFKDKMVLDLGTRDGYMTTLASERGATIARGVEIVPEVAAWAAGQGKDVVAGDMRQLPFGNNMWDTILCIHTLEHLHDPISGVKEILRVLKPNGLFLINVPRERKLNTDAAHNFFFPRIDVLETVVTDAGGIIIKLEEVFSLPPDKDGNQPQRKEILLAGRKPGDG